MKMKKKGYAMGGMKKKGYAMGGMKKKMKAGGGVKKMQAGGITQEQIDDPKRAVDAGNRMSEMREKEAAMGKKKPKKRPTAPMTSMRPKKRPASMSAKPAILQPRAGGGGMTTKTGDMMKNPAASDFPIGTAKKDFGMKKGGGVKKMMGGGMAKKGYKKGGKVRGAGIAQRGVRKAKMR